MTIASLLTPEGQLGTLPALPYNPTSLRDVTGAAYDSLLDRADTGLFRRYVADKPGYDERRDLIQQRFGRDIADEVRKEFPEIGADGLIREVQDRSDRLVMDGRESDPDAWAGIKTSFELDQGFREAAQVRQADLQRTTATAEPLDALAGTLIGGIGATFSSPINLATLPLGMGAGAGILRAMAGEAFINAAIEASQVPLNADLQSHIGFKYGIGDALSDVATAGVGGAALTGVLRGIGPAFRASREATRGATGRILDSVARSDKAPSSVRDAAQYLSRVAHVDEELPPRTGMDPREELATHRRAVEETQESLRNQREPNYAEARMAELERRLDAGVPEAERPAILREMDELADRAIEEKGLNAPRRADAQPVKNTDTPQFQEWFAGSRAADEDGAPIRLYHGTSAEFSEFDTTGGWTPGSWFAVAPGKSEAFGNKTVPVYLSVRNPGTALDLAKARQKVAAEMGEDAGRKETNEAVIRELESQGFDGIHAKNFNGAGGKEVWVAFRPEQIKSVFNPGTFDPNNPRLNDARDLGSPGDADLAKRPQNPAESLRQAAAEGAGIGDTLQADFARLLKDKPDMKLLVDGEEKTLKEIAQTLEEDDIVLDAIRTCGLG